MIDVNYIIYIIINLNHKTSLDIDFCSDVKPVFKPEFSPNIHRENTESPWHSFIFREASVVKRGLLKR